MARRGQRRSARISALEATRQGIGGVGDPGGRGERKVKQIVEEEEEEEEEGFGQDLNSVQELPEKNGGRKKRKLRTVDEVVVSSVERVVEQQEPDIPKHEHQPFNTGQSSTSLPTSGVPEKGLLHLILDILEERDWGKVFADPVDPNEVEGYYEIIKEPMDFGTMRVKLNQGIYTTLDAFKHDVFLVSGNAMHFNASNTYYFRQGSAINELAKKIFYTLRTDPEDYEALSSLRTRRGRKPGSLSKLSKNVRPNSITNGVAPRGSRPCSSYGSSALRRNIQACSGPSSPSPRFDKTDYENHSGFKDGRRSIISEEDSRQTFKPWRYFLNCHEDTASMVYESPKQLVNANEGGIRYSESLMTFVKDLGPTAQIVAKRKLQTSQVGANNCQIPAPSTQQRPNPPNRIINIPASQKIPPNFSGHPTVLTNNCEKQDTPGAFRGEVGHQSRSSGTCVNVRNLNFSINGTPNSGNGYLRTVDSSKLDNQVPLADLASKLPPTKLLDFICKRNNGFMPSSSRFQAMRESDPSQASRSAHEVGASSMSSSSGFQAMRETDPSQASRSAHEVGASSISLSSHFQAMRESYPSQASRSAHEVGASSMSSPSHFQAMKESDPSQSSSSVHEVGASSMSLSSRFQAIRESNPTQASNSIHEVGGSSMPLSSRFQASRESNPTQASNSIHEVGGSSMPSSSRFQGMRDSNPIQASNSIHELGSSFMPSSSRFQAMRESYPSQASGSIQEFGASFMPLSSSFQGIVESNPSQASDSIYVLGSSSKPLSSGFQGMRESNPIQASGSIHELRSSSIPSSFRFQGTRESNPRQASGVVGSGSMPSPSPSRYQEMRESNPNQASDSIHVLGSNSKPLWSGFQGMRESNPIQASGSIHELRSSSIPSSFRFHGTRESNPRQASGYIHEVGSGSMPSPSRYQGMRESNLNQASGSSIHELGSSSLSRENHALTTPGSSYRFSHSQASEVPKWNQCSLESHSLDADQNQARAEQNPTLATDSVMLGQVLEWNRCNMGSNSFGGENLEIAAPGPNRTFNSIEVEQVVDWNRSNGGLHSFGGERNQAKVEESQTYTANSSLLGQVVDWNRLSLGSNPFAIENLAMAKPGPSCIVNSTEAEPIMKWNQPNLGTRYFGGDNVAMTSAPDPSCAVSLAETEPVNEWNGLSLGSLSLNEENQALDANGLIYGGNSAQLGSVPDWNQQNLGSHSFGGENQAMDTSGLGYPVEMTSEGSSIQEWNHNQQRECNPQPQALIDISYLQNGFRQRDLRLVSVPEDAVLEPMRFYGRVPTHHSHHQAELNTLALLDNQQPDLALQL